MLTISVFYEKNHYKHYRLTLNVPALIKGLHLRAAIDSGFYNSVQGIPLPKHFSIFVVDHMYHYIKINDQDTLKSCLMPACPVVMIVVSANPIEPPWFTRRTLSDEQSYLRISFTPRMGQHIPDPRPYTIRFSIIQSRQRLEPITVSGDTQIGDIREYISTNLKISQNSFVMSTPNESLIRQDDCVSDFKLNPLDITINKLDFFEDIKFENRMAARYDQEQHCITYL